MYKQFQSFFEKEKNFYLSQITDNIAPFWIAHSIDEEFGGYANCLTREGNVFDYDKLCTWMQGRISWFYSHLYNYLSPRKEWKDMAGIGIDFIQKFCLNDQGLLYYTVSREGTPLVGSIDLFGDLSHSLALFEYAIVTGDEKYRKQARDIFFHVNEVFMHPESNPYRTFFSSARPMHMNAEYMILLNNAQENRKYDPEYFNEYDMVAKECIRRMFKYTYHEDKKVVFEAVALDGSQLPGTTGRWIDPGHMIELGWFLMEEYKFCHDEEILEKALNIMNWGFEWGWDKKRGGIKNNVDIGGTSIVGPNNAQWPYADTKMWWSHLEAIYSYLLAFDITKDPAYLIRYGEIKNWSFANFADEEYGEWYCNLSLENNVLDGYTKGSDCKACYHIGRTFYNCYRLFESMEKEIADKSE